MDNQSRNWKKFSTEEIEILLPDTFIGGQPKKDKKKIEAEILKVPLKYQKIMKNYFKSQSKDYDTPLITVDTMVDDSYDYLTILTTNIEKLPLLKIGLSLEKYIDQSIKKIGKKGKLIEKGLVNLQNYQASRVVMHYMENAGLFKKPTKTLQIAIIYSIKVSSRIWNFFYFTTPARYEIELPYFEESIDSVIIKSK
jgi:hypothetical protein